MVRSTPDSNCLGSAYRLNHVAISGIEGGREEGGREKGKKRGDTDRWMTLSWCTVGKMTMNTLEFRHISREIRDCCRSLEDIQ